MDVMRKKLYRAWSNMLSRCYDEENANYSYYGGRGISVCKRWHAFERFLKDMSPAPSPKHSLDRVDNDGNYKPSNCRWATASEQALNQRRKTHCKYGHVLAGANIRVDVSLNTRICRQCASRRWRAYYERSPKTKSRNDARANVSPLCYEGAMKRSRWKFTSLVLMGLVGCSYISGKGDADKFADEWAATNLDGAEDVAHTYQSRDNDDNGYVTCTISARWPGSSERQIIPVECGVNRTFTGCQVEGCRPLTPLGIRTPTKSRQSP